MQHILKSYLKKLTNLSGSNRSLLLLRLISDQILDLHDFDFQLGKPSFSLIEDLVAGKREIPLCETVDPRDKDTGKLSLRLRKLARMERLIFEERGSHDLYVGWPMVWGKLNDGTMVRAPLIFYPVSLVEKGKNWTMKVRSDVNISFNKSFLLAYSFFNQIKLDEELFEYTLEDSEPDSTVFRTHLYQLLKDSNVSVVFNRENFIDKLEPFRNFRKADFEAAVKPGHLTLMPEAVLGIFPQSGSYLVPDYLEIVEDQHMDSMEEFFARKSAPQHNRESYFPDFSARVEEEQIFTPFPMDAYQENALKMVREGRSLVIQGPPGTGKTQLIGNLVSDYVARGKKVLVVSQKKAALQVLHDRLKSTQLDQFIGLVHDYKDDRKKIFSQIDRQIEHINEYKLLNNNLDTVQMERRFLKSSRKIDQLCEQLEEFRHALYDTRESGVSIKELYLNSDPNGTQINIKSVYADFPIPKAEEFSSKIVTYFKYARRFNQSDYPWQLRKNFAQLQFQDLTEIKSSLDNIRESFSNWSTQIERFTGHSLQAEDVWLLFQKIDDIKDIIRHLEKQDIYPYLQQMMVQSEKKTDDLWLSTIEKVVNNCFESPGVETSVQTEQLGKIQEILHRALQRLNSPLKWLQWKFFTREKDVLKGALIENGLKLNKRGVITLSEKIDNRLNLEHNLVKLNKQDWLVEVPSYKDPKSQFQNWFFLQKQAVQVKRKILGVRNLITLLDFRKAPNELLSQLHQLHSLLSGISVPLLRWEKLLDTRMIRSVINEPEQVDLLKESLDEDFEALSRYDRLFAEMSNSESSVLRLLEEAVSDYNGEKAVEYFLNSIRLAWINHIETKYHILRIVNSGEIQQIEEELQQSYKDKQSASRDILLQKLREATYQNITVNRLNNPTTYRDLKHQVTKRKRIWPLRKVVMEFQEELFQLIPAWFCSPETVSAIFPITMQFDLVIFDEASQCFAERGLPAIYRGSQVAIAGDDKQLKPNDLYRVRWEEDEMEDEYALEVESLLDLTSFYLPVTQLNGHYRSQSFDLIDFSNTHFYQGKLTLLPERKVFNRKEPNIIYEKVDGVWENNTNPVEAHQVIARIKEFNANYPEDSLGVVTFNVYQQNLILDLLDEEASKGNKVAANLFVKNIENVQGDECDILLFSMGYAADKNGKMNMQFGSLNQKGGENRLNVAITRARKKIVMITSIYPDQLKVENVKNQGPKLLKAYLQYVMEVWEGNFIPSQHFDSGHGADWYLRNKISSISTDLSSYHGFSISESLPGCDLTVMSDRAHEGVILTDDDLYYQAASVKDPHIYKPLLLQERNWPYQFFYSREYWKNREKFEENLTTFVNKMVREE